MVGVDKIVEVIDKTKGDTVEISGMQSDMDYLSYFLNSAIWFT